jgi:hypothetical protein
VSEVEGEEGGVMRFQGELLLGLYRGMDVETEWKTQLDATTLLAAAHLIAQRAQDAYAWEYPWPRLFQITRPDGKVFHVEVNRVVVPQYSISKLVEVEP